MGSKNYGICFIFLFVHYLFHFVLYTICRHSIFFVNRINVEELSISQWADLACNYAGGLGYTVDDMALLALHAKIDELNVPTARFSFENVKQLMDEAISRAEKRNSGRLFSAFSKKNNNVLTESDFI